MATPSLSEMGPRIFRLHGHCSPPLGLKTGKKGECHCFYKSIFYTHRSRCAHHLSQEQYFTLPRKELPPLCCCGTGTGPAIRLRLGFAWVHSKEVAKNKVFGVRVICQNARPKGKFSIWARSPGLFLKFLDLISPSDGPCLQFCVGGGGTKLESDF
jgi:hypothetical protein